ncbi:Flp pilus assembly protein RcpC/CpaB [Liberibacter crescens BT-1]|uniref:Flp pilus assembly protein RcpC/CpaB n=1 Tax=Liberibacter crescens (strain BT-1) TaxID=1215343 RepID=L0EWD7_LIBCB|nr:Flp pilus assembly protein CpaB [Liberibacter crescens]AGA65277.1 Flp pilus assembly protein RcpC/CpaB [Liberibacter crescens BT-1]AMC13210.1 pilus assembly protein CpaB [Liberibacter crescens]
MKLVRITILAVSAVAAGFAGILAMHLARNRPVQKVEIEKSSTIKFANVLVSNENIPIGARINKNILSWIAWPADNVFDGFITEDKRPKAIEELDGAVIRLPILKGEPVRTEKLVDSSNRIMSSILPSGKRAIAMDISVSTGAGGFILPNDRVDVMMVRMLEEGKSSAETILSNIRVLAIDQNIEDGKDGQKSSIGSTATLELTPEQVKVILSAQQMASRLALVLRSTADSKEPDTDYPHGFLGGGGVEIIKSGVVSHHNNIEGLSK